MSSLFLVFLPRCLVLLSLGALPNMEPWSIDTEQSFSSGGGIITTLKRDESKIENTHKRPYAVDPDD